MKARLIAVIALLVIVTAACGDDSVDTSAPPAAGGAAAERGATLFDGTCQGCHGEGAVGVPGLGKPLVDSEFIQGMTDEELAQFVIAGRPSDDPDNTTGVDMPPRGGNPSLTDADILDIVAFLRTLQG